MNKPHYPTVTARSRSLAAALMAAMLAVSSVQATPITWSPTAATTAWATGTNWINGTAPASDLTNDIAVFNSTTYTSQPNAGTTLINGIQIGDGTTATGALTISGTSLSIGGSGISIFANAGAATISATAVKIGANQSWTNDSSSLFTVSSTISNVGNVTPFTLTLAGSGNTTLSGIISNGGTTGTTALTKSGAGTLTLSGANTYTGTTTISAGTLAIAADNNLGATAAAVSLNGGTLKLTSATTVTNTHAFTVGAGGGTINVASVTPQYYFNTANTLLGSGALTVSGGGTLTANIGNLRLAQTNTYSGAITINSGGSIEYGVAGAVGTGATFTIGNQGELAVQNGVTLPNNITVSGGTNSVLSFENGITGIFSGTVTLNANAIIGLRDWYNYATVRGGTISGQITGAGGITVNSGTGTGGTLSLTNITSNYSGGTTITSSTVTAQDGGTNNFVKALGTGLVTLNGTGSTLNLRANGSGSTQTIITGDGTTGNNVSVGANTTIDVNRVGANTGSTFQLNTLSIGANTLNVTGGNSYGLQFAGATTLTGNATFNPTTAPLTFSGALGGSGFGFTKLGAGALNLAGANTYTGATTLGASNSSTSAGTTTLNGANGSISNSSGISVYGSGTKLTLDNSVTNNNDRIANNVSMGVGTELVLTGNGATASTTEALGALSLDAGSIVTIGGAGTGQVVTLSATSFSRGSTNATALIRGNTLGGQAANVGRLLIDGANGTGLALIGSSQTNTGVGSGSTTSLKIVPYLVGDTSISGTGSNFLTYDTTSGLRTLGNNEQAAPTAGYTTSVTPDNIKLSTVAGNTSLTLTNAAGITVNSLAFISGTGNLNSTNANALTVNSGAIAAFTSGVTNTIGSGFSQLNLDNNEGVVTALGTSVITINTPVDVTSGGTHSGNGALTKAGAGTLVLGASNLYSGVTTVNAGTLQIGTGTAGDLGSNTANIVVNTGATLSFGRTNSGLSLSNVISGLGGVTQNGSGGTTILTGANTYSGATTISAGTLQFNGTSTMSGSSALMLNSGGTLALRSDSNATFTPASIAAQSGAITVNITAGALSSGSNNTLTLGTSGIGLQLTGDNTVSVSASNGYTVAIPLLLLNQTVNDNTIQTLSVASGNTLQVGTVTANDVNNRLAFSGAGNTVVTGSITQAQANRGMGLVFNQSGTVTLSGTGTNLRNNTNSGSDKNVVLNSGTVNFNSNAAINSSQSVAFNINGGTVDNTSGSAVTLTGTHPISIAGNFGYGGTNDLNLGTQGTTLNGAAGSRTITTNGSATLTLSGVIANGTASGLTKAGVGVLALTNAGNTFSGGLTINAGTVIQGGAATGAQGTGTITLGDGATSASATLSGAGTAAITNTNAITIASGGSGTYTIADTSAQDYNFSGAVALNNSATFKVTGAGQLTFSNSITGSSLITIDGAGTGTKFVKLSGDNSSSFTGNLLIQNGNARQSGLKLGSSNALSNANTVIIDANSAIDLGGFNLSVAGLNDVVTGAGGSIVTGVGNIALGGSGTYSFSGVINNTGAKNLTKSGSGTQTLAGANTYTGATTLSAGTLSVATIGNGGVAGNLGQATNAAANLVFDDGTLRYTGATASTDRNFTINNGKTASFDVTANVLTLAGASTATSGALTKLGAGTLTLSGANSYTGLTTVSAGTLALGSTGSIASSSGITVASGAIYDVSAVSSYTLGTQTLRGAGTVNGAVSVGATGTVAAGVDASTIGTLSFNNTLTGTSGSTFSLKLKSDTGSFDLLTATGAVTLGSATLSLVEVGTGTWTGTASPFSILHGASISGTFVGYSDGGTVVVGSNTYTINYGATDVTLTASAIPEPATYAALFGAVALVGAAVRRRRKS